MQWQLMKKDAITLEKREESGCGKVWMEEREKRTLININFQI